MSTSVQARTGPARGLPTITSRVGLTIGNMTWKIWDLKRGTRRDIYTFRRNNCPASLTSISCAYLLMAATDRGMVVRRQYFTAPASHKLVGVTGKSSLMTTLITGSTTAGEDIPPHFQFLVKALTAEKLRVELVAYTPHVRGQYGAPEDQA